MSPTFAEMFSCSGNNHLPESSDDGGNEPAYKPRNFPRNPQRVEGMLHFSVRELTDAEGVLSERASSPLVNVDKDGGGVVHLRWRDEWWQGSDLV